MEVQAQGRGTAFLGTNDVYTSFTIAQIILGWELGETTSETRRRLRIKRALGNETRPRRCLPNSDECKDRQAEQEETNLLGRSVPRWP